MADQPEAAPLNGYIDHTLLRPDSTARDIEKLCTEAVSYTHLTLPTNREV